MKKWSLLFLVFMLIGCSQTTGTTPLFTEKEAVPFEIVTYEEKISPVFTQLAPYIILAKTEDHLQQLLAQFDVEATVDMTTKDAVMLVTYSDSCGVMVNNVYDNDRKLSVQLTSAAMDKESCEKVTTPHTFVLAVDKQEYEKVQLYDGDIIKSSLDLQ